ncbi:MAG: hypothetical protein O7D86_15455 [Proteobacteria bacterium]|nr:hypothetical protein [Pseudomonadota bacterium]
MKAIQLEQHGEPDLLKKEVANAHRQIETGHTARKIILDIM